MTGKGIIVVGAGAAGLMAARELVKKGFDVTVLEARDHVGGRAHTIYNAPFTLHAEMGAEFVHGHLPVSFSLLDEAGIPVQPTGGKPWQVKDGKLKQGGRQIDNWKEFEEALEKLETDMTLNEFLQQYFPQEKYESLRVSVRGYAAGFDTADPDRASSFALRDEWLGEGYSTQYRVKAGYTRLMQYLADELVAGGGQLILNAVVKDVIWSEENVKVVTDEGESYSAGKIVFSVSLGIWQAEKGEKGAINFTPAIPEQMNALARMGIGAIIKILMQFKEPFWEWDIVKQRADKSLEDMSFLMSKEMVPTWWTQYPDKSSLLTGWLGGPAAYSHKDKTDEEILQMAFTSLSNIFGIPVAELQKICTASIVVNWTADPFARGSYAYDTVPSKEAKQLLHHPVKDTLYFAGEALYDGIEMGTVEAALASGKNIAAQIN